MKRNKTVGKENYLDKVPAFSEKLSWRQEDDGLVTILMENTGIFNRIFQVFFKKPKVSYIHLDEMGSFILPLVDGRRSVYAGAGGEWVCDTLIAVYSLSVSSFW